MRLDLTADPIDLTAALVDIPSVSGAEDALVTAVTEALGRQAPTMELLRTGNVVMARTVLGRPTRVLLAGHLDTVPIADNVPSHREGDVLHGCGTSDMKSGDAMILHVAATVENPTHDITVIMYDCEEIERERNGLTRIERDHRDWLEADLAILAEPTNGQVEAGCQGTMRAVLRTKGVRSHAARSWLGDNAIHHAGAILRVLEDYQPRAVDIDGCLYREGLNAVGVTGGVAGNVIPDECAVEINFRFAPDRSVAQAQDHIREVFPDIDIEFADAAPGALPGLSAPATQAFMAVTGTTAVAKYGWTDVSRFAALGIPALNYGPGDPNMAHKRDEHVMTPQITDCANTLRRYLTTPV